MGAPRTASPPALLLLIVLVLAVPLLAAVPLLLLALELPEQNLEQNLLQSHAHPREAAMLLRLLPPRRGPRPPAWAVRGSMAATKESARLGARASAPPPVESERSQ